MTDLGSLAEEDTKALGINNHGQIVGVSSVNGEQHAFYYYKSMMKDLLGTRGRANSVAYGINDSGKTVGESWQSSQFSDSRAFLYTPSSHSLPARLFFMMLDFDVPIGE
jgi:probable HAF family extracellular repeat protein